MSKLDSFSDEQRGVLEKNRAAEDLVQALPEGKVRCLACAHRCTISEGERGICLVRYNHDGQLYVPYGYVAAFQVDPIEKKPFYHVLPGNLATSFGTLGCDFHCAYCQNWTTSQVLRDEIAEAPVQEIDADFILSVSQRYQAKIIASTYNEPLITSEWAKSIFEKAKGAGLLTAFISNGNATPEVLHYLKPVCDLYKVDLKCFDDKKYRRLGGTLKAVCDSILMLKELGYWVEIVTLLVPGYNDKKQELSALASFICSVSAEIPWHITAFHPDYKMTDYPFTQQSHLLQAAEIGREAGLQFIYLGNLPGGVGDYENTICPSCQETLIRRQGFRIKENIMKGNACPKCQTVIPGVFEI